MVLLLKEADVKAVLTMEIALEAVEEAFQGLADGSAINHSRRRLALDKGVCTTWPAPSARATRWA